jgi:hypothetical protein
MPKPPMNDTIMIKTQQLDENGEPKKDGYGRPLPAKSVPSKARVKNEAKTNIASDSMTTDNVLEIAVPNTTVVEEGQQIEWTDRFGEEITGQIDGITEVLNYSGKKVYYRKLIVNKAGG